MDRDTPVQTKQFCSSIQNIRERFYKMGAKSFSRLCINFDRSTRESNSFENPRLSTFLDHRTFHESGECLWKKVSRYKSLDQPAYSWMYDCGLLLYALLCLGNCWILVRSDVKRHWFLCLESLVILQVTFARALSRNYLLKVRVTGD